MGKFILKTEPPPPPHKHSAPTVHGVGTDSIYECNCGAWLKLTYRDYEEYGGGFDYWAEMSDRQIRKYIKKGLVPRFEFKEIK